MNITNITAAATIDGVKCCKIWHKPDGVISGLHFVYSALAFLLAALFFCILSVEHKIVEFIQNEKAGGSIGFWCPPFMCIFIGIDTLIVGLGTYDYQSTCCLIGEGVLHARYVVRSIIHPLVLISTFEQTYLTFKRRSANFCCIKFDDGHRKKSTRLRSKIARASAWIYGLGMLTWTLITNISLIYEPVEPSKMRRFTTKSLNVKDPWSVDVLELSIFLIFLFYLSFEIWRYGTTLAFQINTTYCNKWSFMFGATTLILVSYLLPAAQSIYFADLSLVIFLVANFKIELMILEDLRRARALQKNFDLKGEELRRKSELEWSLKLQAEEEEEDEENGLLDVQNPMLANEKNEDIDEEGEDITLEMTNSNSSAFETPQAKTSISELDITTSPDGDDVVADVNDIGIMLDDATADNDISKDDSNNNAKEKEEEEVIVDNGNSNNNVNEKEETIIVTVDAHNSETKTVTKQSLVDDRSRTGFAIGDRVNVFGKVDSKLYPATVYNIGESQVELRWDDGDASNRLHAFDVPKLITTTKIETTKEEDTMTLEKEPKKETKSEEPKKDESEVTTDDNTTETPIGTPAMKTKTNPNFPGPLKKDGTPDMRYKANKDHVKQTSPDSNGKKSVLNSVNSSV